MNLQKTNSKNFHNKTGFYLFLGTMVFSSLWALYFLFMNNRIDLGEYKMQSIEGSKAEGLIAEEKAKPWLFTKGLTEYGAKIYKAQCALCHGAKGLGDGSPGLIPPPRNLVEGKWKQGGSSKELFITLQKGMEGSSMVSFKHLPLVDRWAVVHYVRSITGNKTPDNAKELEEFAQQTK